MNTEEILQEESQQETITTVAEEKKKKSALFYINIILLLLIVGLGGYILYKEGYWTKQKEQEMEETEEATEDQTDEGSVIVEVKEPVFEDFVGEFVRAKLPEGWSIKEYKDGDGTDYMSEVENIKGLTGLEVKKGSVVVLKLQALYGYGSNSCPELVRFKDYSQKWEDDMKKQNDEMGDKTTILDYTKTPYVETTIFGLPTRRVEKVFYYDEVEGDAYFQAQCLKQILIFKDLKFAVGEGSNKTESGHYGYLVDSSVSGEELTVLDGILKSMAVK